ncbi:hypothetical protein [Allonocardiopsis opalescens]|uniref:Uncharacterized protein n=1 Tax=Allonocardiopsis opalescens TaxID=1144618 RepID=A0A2T0QD29_9ACTN|nr:hypothetical protein [Allonocardiopsis opalescens]PRY01837.1 hypothetical protein CLV72_101434 [Allonocardiopsis opalescens]
MGFAIALRPPSQWPEPPTVVPPEDADFATAVMRYCELLAETDCAFHVGGFGEPHWPVDVAYDLSAVIEQLPDLLSSLRERRAGSLDFYGQGIERTLEFTPNGDTTLIRCGSRTAWRPDPEVETAHGSELEDMLTALAHDFAVSAARLHPPAALVPQLADWLGRSGRIQPE